MNKPNFDSILDECLQAMASGESLESCLARYPQSAEELRPLLSLAQDVRRIPTAEPSPEARTAAWQRFYRRASELQIARQRGGFGWLRPVAITAAVLLAFVAAGGGTIYAASKSLPDSPLYRVKLFTEEAQLWFVFDEQEEADILLSQAETRIDEITALVQEDKPIPENVLSALRQRTAKAVRITNENPEDARLIARARELASRHEDLLVAVWENVQPDAQRPYAGTLATLHNAQLVIGKEGEDVPTFNPQELEAGVLEVSGSAQPSSADPGTWSIGGVEVLVDSRTLGQEGINPNHLTKAVVARGSDGRLRCLKLTVEPQAESEGNIVISGVVEAVSNDQVRVAGQDLALTQETLARLRLRSGQRVQVTVRTVSGRAVAIEVKPLPEEETEQYDLFTYEGTVEGGASLQQELNYWPIGGQAFIVPQNVALDALAGEAAPGARVRVEAVRQNGDIVANRIVVLASEGTPSDQLDLEGVLEEVTNEGRWQLSGLLVEVPEKQPAPPLGSIIKIEGQRSGQEIKAQRVLVLQRPDSQDGLIKMNGLILQVNEDRLRLGIVVVELDDDTEISGEPIVGARALVWGRPSGRGALEAVYVDVLDSKPVIPFRGGYQEDDSGTPGDDASQPTGDSD